MKFQEKLSLAIVDDEPCLVEPLVDLINRLDERYNKRWKAFGFCTITSVTKALRKSHYDAAIVDVGIGNYYEFANGLTFESLVEEMLGLGTIVVATTGMISWESAQLRSKYNISLVEKPYDYDSDIMRVIEERLGC